MPVTRRVHKELGFTHQEIHRLLPVLADGMHSLVEPGRIVLSSGLKRIEILLEPERVRQLSQIVRMPYTPMDLIFHDCSDEDQIEFERRFDRVYFKGGG